MGRSLEVVVSDFLLWRMIKVRVLQSSRNCVLQRLRE